MGVNSTANIAISDKSRGKRSCLSMKTPRILSYCFAQSIYKLSFSQKTYIQTIYSKCCTRFKRLAPNIPDTTTNTRLCLLGKFVK